MKLFGFTLAELLIALAMLGVIATFTIPKVLNAQQDASFSAIAKEAAAMVSEGLQSYRVENEITQFTTVSDLTPFFNYVSVDSVSIIDGASDSFLSSSVFGFRVVCPGTAPNAGNIVCLRLHNGGVLAYAEEYRLHDNTSAFPIIVDPNGTLDGSPGNHQSVLFYIGINGRLTSSGHSNGSMNVFSAAGACGPPAGCPTTQYAHPPWFSWN